MRLKDKAIVVTGSTTGIGEAIARRCVAEGARVLIHGLEPDLGEKVAGSLGPSAALHIDDLLDAAAPQRVIDAALKAFGKIDGLVNNAAWVVRSHLENTDADFFIRVMRINALAPLLMIQAALPHLKQSRGCALNIGSINAYAGEANLLAYSASKGALMTLSRNLANSLAQESVRVNHFNVGWVLTENEFKTKLKDGLTEEWLHNPPRTMVPSGKLLTPEHIGAAAVYWLSDESRPITGSVLELEQFAFIGFNPTK